MKQLSATDLAAILQQQTPPNILDVREGWECDRVRLPNCIHIPMGEITSRWQELPLDQPVVCLCHHGARSMQVAFFLEQQGFQVVYNLHGGIDAWSRQVDPSYPTY